MKLIRKNDGEKVMLRIPRDMAFDYIFFRHFDIIGSSKSMIDSSKRKTHSAFDICGGSPSVVWWKSVDKWREK